MDPKESLGDAVLALLQEHPPSPERTLSLRQLISGMGKDGLAELVLEKPNQFGPDLPLALELSFRGGSAAVVPKLIEAVLALDCSAMRPSLASATIKAAVRVAQPGVSEAWTSVKPPRGLEAIAAKVKQALGGGLPDPDGTSSGPLDALARKARMSHESYVLFSAILCVRAGSEDEALLALAALEHETFSAGSKTAQRVLADLTRRSKNEALKSAVVAATGMSLAPQKAIVEEAARTPDWAEALEKLITKRAAAGLIHRHCAEWMAASGISSIRNFLAELPAERLISFRPVVEWLLRRSDRTTPETDIPLAERLLAAGGSSAAFCAAFIATVCRFGDMETLALIDAAWSGKITESPDQQRALLYRTLAAEPSALSAADLQVFQALAAVRLGDGERLRTIAVRPCDGNPARRSVEAAAELLALCFQQGWTEASQALVESLSTWPTGDVLSLARSSLTSGDTVTTRRLVDNLLVRDDFKPAQLALMSSLLNICHRRREGFFYARRARFEGLADAPWVSNILLRGLEHDKDFLEALSKGDAVAVNALADVYAPEQSGSLTTVAIKSVGQVCHEMNWPYEEVLAPAKIAIPHPVFFGGARGEPPETVMHPPIYRAELLDAVVYGGSWFAEAAGAGIYEPMQGPGSARFVHRDSTAIYGAGRHLFYRRAASGRKLASAVWMLGAAPNNYYHWLYDICSRSLARFEAAAWPADTVMLVDEAVLGIPQMVEILRLINASGLTVETVWPGEAVEVQRLFVSAPSTWGVIHLREDARPLQATDSIIHPQAVAALRTIAAPHLSRLRQGRRIFLSRKGVSNPRLDNEAELAALAEGEFGFEVVDPSRLSFAEQVRAFSEAEAVVGATGGAMSNLAFCSEGSKALCLIADRFDYSAWQSIGAAAGCRVTHVAGEPRNAFAFNEYHAQFGVSPEQFRQALRQTLHD